MELSDFLKMQHDLAVEKGWIWDRTPEQGPFSLLWSMDELGEAISIIKKKGSYGIMENPAVREHFVEEIADHLMYVFDMMECYSITAEEFEKVYVKKFERNMGRSWSENRAMYENVGITSAVIDGRYLPDERLWELLIRAGVKDMKACIESMEDMLLLLKAGDYMMGGENHNSHGCMVMFPDDPKFPGMPKNAPDRRLSR